MEVFELCKKYRNDGVVAIDLAGDESINCKDFPLHSKAYKVQIPSLSMIHVNRYHLVVSFLILIVQVCFCLF